MKISELTPEHVPQGTRIWVSWVDFSRAEQDGGLVGAAQLLYESGTVINLVPGPIAQLRVEWDSDVPGRLMPSGDDKVQRYVTVYIENGYEDGHTSEATVDVPVPGKDMDDWWEQVVSPHTGDGTGEHQNAWYQATITRGPASLLGQRREWMG